MLIRLLGVLALTLGAALPAQAGFYCDDNSSASITFDFGFGKGSGFTDQQRNQQRNQFDLAELRRRGVDATSVERWNGCVLAFVRKPEGGQEMRYYDPATLEELP